MRRFYCDTCPFETNDDVARKGHEAGPSRGRGWFGKGETHVMTERCFAAYPGAATWANGSVIRCDDIKGHDGQHGNAFAARYWA